MMSIHETSLDDVIPWFPQSPRVNKRFDCFTKEKLTMAGDIIHQLNLPCVGISMETMMALVTGESLLSISLFDRDVSCDDISANARLFEPDNWPTTKKNQKDLLMASS